MRYFIAYDGYWLPVPGTGYFDTLTEAVGQAVREVAWRGSCWVVRQSARSQTVVWPVERS